MEKGLPIGNPFCLKSRLVGKFCTSLVSLRLTYAKYASACLTARSPKFPQPYNFLLRKRGRIKVVWLVILVLGVLLRLLTYAEYARNLRNTPA